MQVRALGYVGVETVDPDPWADFGPNVLGLEISRRGSDGSIYLRMDERCHRIAIHPGPADRLAYVGWEVPNRGSLEQACRELEATGLEPRPGTAEECELRNVRGLITFTDVVGVRVELFYGPLVLAAPFHSPRAIGGFVTGTSGSLGLGHVVIGAGDLDQAERFYTEVMGFRVSDYTRLVFFHCNGRHHSLGLGPDDTPGRLHHIMLEVASLDDVGRTYALVQERGIPVVIPFGRHSNDLTYSFYMRSPSGFAVEYGWGGRLVDDASWSVAQMENGSVWRLPRPDGA
jgi:2,3-dihydroxybiphenyl 1,2-dioxygenase